MDRRDRVRGCDGVGREGESAGGTSWSRRVGSMKGAGRARVRLAGERERRNWTLSRVARRLAILSLSLSRLRYGIANEDLRLVVHIRPRRSLAEQRRGGRKVRRLRVISRTSDSQLPRDSSLFGAIRGKGERERKKERPRPLDNPDTWCLKNFTKGRSSRERDFSPRLGRFVLEISRRSEGGK